MQRTSHRRYTSRRVVAARGLRGCITSICFAGVMLSCSESSLRPNGVHGTDEVPLDGVGGSVDEPPVSRENPSVVVPGLDPATHQILTDEELAGGEFDLTGPVLTSVVTNSRTPELSWSEVPGAQAYEIWLNVTRNDYDWAVPGNLLDRYTLIGEGPNSRFTPSALPDRWTYKWFVVAKLPGDVSKRSIQGRFSLYLPQVEQVDDGVALIDGARDINQSGSIEPFEDWKRPVAERVDDLLTRLSPELKALQLFYNFKEEPRAGFQMGPIGNPQEIHDWLVQLGTTQAWAIPFVVAGDTTHGYQTSYPTNVGLAATRDASLAYRLSDVARKELLVSGQRGLLAPIAEVGTKVQYPRIQEGWGEDADLAATMMRATVAGLQAGPELNPQSVMATTKHWPGEGAGGEGGIVFDAVTIKWHMKPWFAAIEANTASIMPGYAGSDFLDPADASCGNCPDQMVCYESKCVYGGHGGGDSHAIIAYLRDEMNYDGLITTDWLPWGAWVGAANAGSDAMGGADPNATGFSLQDFISKVPEARLNDAVRRVLEVKFRMGLFENPFPDVENAPAVWKAATHKLAAIEAAQKSLTLLRNQDDLLPLQLAPGEVVLVDGPAAANFNPADPGMGWGQSANFYTIWTSYFHGQPGQVGPASSITDGLVERAKAAGVVAVGPDDPLATSAKVIVLGLGEPSYTHGTYWHIDGAPGSWLTLSPDQLALIEKYSQGDVPVVGVIILPRPMVLTDIHEKLDALLIAYRPGDGVGRAVAGTLFGDTEPAGRLPFQLPRSIEQVGGDTKETANEQWDLPYDLGASDEERTQIRSLIEKGALVPSGFGDPLYAFGAGIIGYARSGTGGGIDGSSGNDEGVVNSCEDVPLSCDPTIYEACGGGSRSCRGLADGSTSCVCASSAAGPQNAPCAQARDCQGGFICHQGTCKTICDPEANPTTCEGGLPCQSIGDGSFGHCDS